MVVCLSLLGARNQKYGLAKYPTALSDIYMLCSQPGSQRDNELLKFDLLDNDTCCDAYI